MIKQGDAADSKSAQDILSLWSDEKLGHYLRELSVGNLFSALAENAFMGMLQVPTVKTDGTVVPIGNSAEIFSDATLHNQTPVILGSNRDENTLFMFQSPKYVDTTLGVFNSLIDENDYRKEVYYRSTEWKADAVDGIADLLVDSGNSNVYAYRFDWDEGNSLLGFDLSVALGATHAIEIDFVFGSFELGSMFERVFPNDDNQFNLSRQMMSYWAEFAYNGNPGKGRRNDLPHWTPWKSDGKTVIILDTPSDGGIRMDDVSVSLAALRSELVQDDGFNDNETRCSIYATLDANDAGFNQADWQAMGCGHLDPESFLYYE